MSQQRGTTTSDLSNVIQVIQLGRKTGLLTVERGEGTTREEGAISFANGQVVQVRASRLTGQAALKWLQTWGECRFIFVPTNTERTTQPLPSLQGSTTQALTETQQQHAFSSTARITPTGALGISKSLPRTPQIVPWRTRSFEEATHVLEKAGLSRLHRHLLLLVDGQRTLQELARLVGRSPEDVQRLLNDLTTIGLIQQ